MPFSMWEVVFLMWEVVAVETPAALGSHMVFPHGSDPAASFPPYPLLARATSSWCPLVHLKQKFARSEIEVGGWVGEEAPGR